MNNSDIALQITLKALEDGYIARKSDTVCEGPDPVETANRFAAKQISDFYIEVLRRLNEI